MVICVTLSGVLVTVLKVDIQIMANLEYLENLQEVLKGPEIVLKG